MRCRKCGEWMNEYLKGFYCPACNEFIATDPESIIVNCDECGNDMFRIKRDTRVKSYMWVCPVCHNVMVSGAEVDQAREEIDVKLAELGEELFGENDNDSSDCVL